MAERVAVGRLIVGDGANRKTIAPGSRFNSEDVGMNAEDLRVMEERGIVRRVRDPNTRVPVERGPMQAAEEGATVEGRSGPATNATSGQPGEQDAEGEAPAGAARRGRRGQNLDDL